MLIECDYLEKTYAGILGKLIGVYLGRPFEMWSHERIMQELGEVSYYVHEHFGLPLVVTDDDIAGTLTFVRALADYGCSRALTAEQIGQTWLNYIIENRTILWWGGNGNSTEHTAYLRLKRGVKAPDSGSIAHNGSIVAEQIGAQIFIDAWAMVAAGDPMLAAELARRAASISHDGVAIHAAQLLAAMEAQAYVESDLNALLDIGLSVIPSNSLIARLVEDVRTWRFEDNDWRKTRARIAKHYGTDRYGGNCHVIPNHAIILLSLLYGGDDLQRALMIAATSGWDTDCNAGNVGCLLGIKNGLAGLEAGPDWRGPIADRLYLPSADGQRSISDAASEAFELVDLGQRLSGRAPIPRPKGGARYHFELPGSVQGFTVEAGQDNHDLVWVNNVAGHSISGERSLAITYRHLAPGRIARVRTATFTPPEAMSMPGYSLLACPKLEVGQTVYANLHADTDNCGTVRAGLFVNFYDGDDHSQRLEGPSVLLEPGQRDLIKWHIQHDPNQPIYQLGIALSTHARADGIVYLNSLDWRGTPSLTLTRPSGNGSMWRRAWVNAMDHAGHHWAEAFHLAQDHGRGLFIRGGRDWHNYTVSATLRASAASSFGIAARVQGLERYYALELTRDGGVQLVKALDGRVILAKAPFIWQYDQPYTFTLTVHDNTIKGLLDQELVLQFEDDDRPLMNGGVALICEEGMICTDEVNITAI